MGLKLQTETTMITTDMELFAIVEGLKHYPTRQFIGRKETQMFGNVALKTLLERRKYY